MFTSIPVIISLLSSLTAVTTSFSSQPLTSAVLRVAYDGTLFHGWTASNNGNATIIPAVYQSRRSGRSRRNRHRPSMKQGEVRSVVSSVKSALSKLYGNVPMDRIVVEGSSRTDKGVHSNDSYALIYCLLDDVAPLSIEGKRLPHPISPRDESFKELPFKSDLKQMIFALNKMLPPDVRVHNASPMPSTIDSSMRPFHPSLDSQRKTYRYTFSVGEIHDPICCRNTWHIPHCTEFDLDRAKECAEILCGTHDFVAFRGAFRGSERGKVQDTVCTLFEVSINEITRNSDSSALCKTFCVDITGDRFLYKQVRLLVGTIVQYARSEHIDKSDISKILDNREWHGRSDHSMDDQNKAPFPKFCAPPQGLSLKSVEFGDEWSFDWIVQKPERVETILVVEG